MGRHCYRWKRTAAMGREPPSELGTKRMICTTYPCWVGVESGCGAVAVGWACLFPPLSSGGALVAQP